MHVMVKLINIAALLNQPSIGTGRESTITRDFVEMLKVIRLNQPYGTYI